MLQDKLSDRFLLNCFLSGSPEPSLYFFAHIHHGLQALLFILFYLFIFRDGGEREGNIKVWLPLARPPGGDLARNPGMFPRLGIEPVTFRFAGRGGSPFPQEIFDGSQILI